jgi:hypothetical protein
MTQGEDTNSQPTEGSSLATEDSSLATVADSEAKSTAQSADVAHEASPGASSAWAYFPPFVRPAAQTLEMRIQEYIDNLQQDLLIKERSSLVALDQPIHPAYQQMWVADRNLLFTAMVRLKRKLKV